MSQQEKDEVKECAGHVQKEFNVQLPPGNSESIYMMNHLNEELQIFYKPVTLHLILYLVTGPISWILLYMIGYKSYDLQELKSINGLKLWYRKAQLKGSKIPFNLDKKQISQQVITQENLSPNAQRDSEKLDNREVQKSPVVLLHGVGLGLYPYIGFLIKLHTIFSDRDIICLDMAHVSLGLSTQSYSVDEVCQYLIEKLHSLGHNKSIFIGHSYGSFLAARIAKRHANVVDRLILLDPVCLLTCYPQLIKNFVYTPVSYQNPNRYMMSLVTWMISRDLIISHVFCRQFLWDQVMLNPQDIPNGSVVFLASQDNLVPFELAYEYIDRENQIRLQKANTKNVKYGIKLEVLEKFAHAQSVLLPNSINKIMDVLNKVYN